MNDREKLTSKIECMTTQLQRAAETIRSQKETIHIQCKELDALTTRALAAESSLSEAVKALEAVRDWDNDTTEGFSSGLRTQIDDAIRSRAVVLDSERGSIQKEKSE